ncbi:hypothetical protein [Escherichia coli]|uniref:hypothetical protein n=1 Tax=Escherichia coli TaxID=562 RepID=UPI0029C11B8A|nr:hypothetical protein [Escherichia coli]MDX5693418.1 hypothetical protein [Escherichia coli]
MNNHTAPPETGRQQGRYRDENGLTALKRLYKGAAGSPVAPFSLLALCGHEQPDCQEGRFPSGTGMNARLRRPFFSPAFSVYDLSEITSPSL